MFIEIHIIQSFAPSNLNRDDTGNPKDTEFGGVRRARISSQCIKRSIRMHPIFSKTTGADLGVRTRWITRLISQQLVAAGKPEIEAQSVADAFASQYCKMDKGHTSVLIYFSKKEINTAIQSLLEKWDEVVKELAGVKNDTLTAIAKEVFKLAKNHTSAPDIALFGRMLAEKPELNLDAACQVAHAISTHRVNMEMDYYTAVDDLSREDVEKEGGLGAAMMGVIPFNSACFYRYARLDWGQLLKNLNGDVNLAANTVSGFLQAAVLAIPTGKQTSFAAQNPPDFALGVVREDGQAWSLVNAFEVPVQEPRSGGLVSPSVNKLDAYWAKLVEVYGSDSIHPAVLSLAGKEDYPTLAQYQTANLQNWVQKLVSILPKE